MVFYKSRLWPAIKKTGRFMNMKDFSIQGLGSISGGEFNRLTVEGMGTNHGDIIAEYLSIEGVFKST